LQQQQQQQQQQVGLYKLNSVYTHAIDSLNSLKAPVVSSLELPAK
jgi:hypothetical protein